MIISDNKTGSIIATSSNMNVSDSIWHSVVVIKSGSHVQLLVDSQVTAETSAAPTQIIGSSSDLFIGGTSSELTTWNNIILGEGGMGKLPLLP